MGSGSGTHRLGLPPVEPITSGLRGDVQPPGLRGGTRRLIAKISDALTARGSPRA